MSDNEKIESTEEEPEVVAHTAEGTEEEDPMGVVCYGYYSSNDAV